MTSKRTSRSDSPTVPGSYRLFWTLVATAALLLLALQALACVSTTSATFDEPYHLGAGYAYLRTGDPRLNNHHPPLIDALLSVPLLLLDPHLPLESPAWQQGEYGSFGDVFVWQANPALALRLIWLGRLPSVALSLLLGAVLFRWLGRWLGRPAGALALLLYALDPGVVAHAGLATNDLGTTATLLLAVWACWRWLRHPTLPRLLGAGVLAGAACTSKFSGLAIGPIAALMTALDVITAHRSPRELRRRVVGLPAIGLTCALTIWAIYRFSIVDGVPAKAFWEGLLFQGGRIVRGQPTYALGRVWPGGVWFYYPLALLLKTPLPTLLFFAWGLGLAVKRRALRTLAPLLIPLLVLTAIVTSSALQLGHRLLLPLLPFVFGVGGSVAHRLAQNERRAPRLQAAALTLWLALSALWITPHNLSFFNALSGGPRNADRYLVDANLDWGQDLPALRATMKAHKIERVHLGYFGSAIPDLYAVPHWPAPGFLRFVGDPESLAFNPYGPEPGWYAISRTSLRQGLVLTHPDIYAYFRARKPVARAGYSIDLYQVTYPEETSVQRAVVQGARVADVPPETLGWNGETRLITKWAADADTFVFAMGGPARYLTPDPLPYAPDLRAVVLPHALPDGEAFTFDARPLVEPRMETWRTSSPVWTPEGEPLPMPVTFDGRIQLLGYHMPRRTASPGADLSLVLFWQVGDDLRPPLAAFVHLLDTQGRPRSQYDGWGTAVRGLEGGDVVVQHARLPLPGDVPPGRYRPQLGLYAPDTMARWPVSGSDDKIIDRIWLPEVEVGE